MKKAIAFGVWVFEGCKEKILLDNKHLEKIVGKSTYKSMAYETRQLLKELEDVCTSSDIDLAEVNAVKKEAIKKGYLMLFKYVTDQEICYIKFIFTGDLIVPENGQRRIYELDKERILGNASKRIKRKR